MKNDRDRHGQPPTTPCCSSAGAVVRVEKAWQTAVEPSERILQIAAMFGLGVDEQRALRVVPASDIPLAPGSLVFVTGPSGSGKSTLLHCIEEKLKPGIVLKFTPTPNKYTPAHARDDAAVAQPPPPSLLPHVPLIEQIGDSLSEAVHTLAVVGLSDAFVMLRTPAQLSDGQRYRASLASLINRINIRRRARESIDQNELLVAIADEFTSTLDRLTASTVARNLRRWVSRQPDVCFICATTHDDLLELLDPDVLVHLPLGESIEIHEKTRDIHRKTSPRIPIRGVSSPSPSFAGKGRAAGSVEPSNQKNGSCSPLPARSSTCKHNGNNLHFATGTFDDYKQLAHHHYRPARPAPATAVFTVREKRPTVVGRYLHRPAENILVGVLVRSLPHLACSLRTIATNNRYTGISDPKQRAALLNRELRTISRVVVDPRYRGLGIAVALVRHALANPETVYTEALAAMGAVNPFFERAGMTRYERPPSPTHARLLAVLAELNIPPWHLASTSRMIEHESAWTNDQRAWFTRELTRWAHTVARPSANSANLTLTFTDCLRLARDRLLFVPVYYLYRAADAQQAGPDIVLDDKSGSEVSVHAG